MTDATPPSCSLDDAALTERLTAWDRLAAGALVERDRSGNRVVLTFDGSAGPDLARLVELERGCCGFLDFRLEPAGARVALVIDGPDGSDATLDAFASLRPGC